MTEAVKTSVKAIWSLVLGILSLICLGCLTGIPAVICGHMALSDIKRSGGALTGEGMAITGLIMGYISIAMMLFVIPILLGLLLPALAQTRHMAQRHACMNGQRQVDSAVEQWTASQNKQEGDKVDEAAVAELLVNGKLPECPKNRMPIAIPQLVGEHPVCPDPEVSSEHVVEW